MESLRRYYQRRPACRWVYGAIGCWQCECPCNVHDQRSTLTGHGCRDGVPVLTATTISNIFFFENQIQGAADRELGFLLIGGQERAGYSTSEGFARKSCSAETRAAICSMIRSAALPGWLWTSLTTVLLPSSPSAYEMLDVTDSISRSYLRLVLKT